MKEKGYSTLAIGDGGNDVAMIQSADVGVGIVGKEGLQAARASDFSISRFYFLVRLMLIHGRYAYNRTSFIALYSFQKSIYICLIQVMYNFYAGFSGASFFDTLQLSTYNVVFTGIPIVFYVLDQDIPMRILILNPSLYQMSKRGTRFNEKLFLFWVARAVFQAMVTLFTVLYFFGSDGCLQPAAITAYSIAICMQMLNLFLESHSITCINILIIFGQIVVMWLLFVFVSVIPDQKMTGYFFLATQTPAFYLAHLSALTFSFLPVFASKTLSVLSNSDYSQLDTESMARSLSEQQWPYRDAASTTMYSEVSSGSHSLGEIREEERLVVESREPLFCS